MAWEGPQYFNVRVSKNAMSAFIPKGTALDPELANLDYQTFLLFLREQHQIRVEPSPEKFADLQQSARRNPYGFKTNYELAVGTAPVEPVPGSLSVIPREGIPSDMVLAGVPYLLYVRPVPAQDGVDVHGEKLPATAFDDPLMDLILPPEMTLDAEGQVIPNTSGQAIVNGNVIGFTPLYSVKDPSDPNLQSTEFYCNVWVAGDLAGSMHWRIFGSLNVEGHLSAGNLEIHGNLEVKSGIQTNYEGVLRVHGSVKTAYVQMTRIGVGEYLLVENGILQSEVRAGYGVRCRGTPGAIQGSTIFCLGSVQANRAGSDQGVATELIMPYVRQIRPIRIDAISSGTKITYRGKSWKTLGNSVFSAQPEGFVSDDKAS